MSTPPSTTAYIVRLVVNLLAGIGLMVFALTAALVAYAIADGASFADMSLALTKLGDTYLGLAIAAAGLAGAGVASRKAQAFGAGLHGAAQVLRAPAAPAAPTSMHPPGEP